MNTSSWRNKKQVQIAKKKLNPPFKKKTTKKKHLYKNAIIKMAQCTCSVVQHNPFEIKKKNKCW